MTDLSALIERLEAAPEGSRELDAEIAAAIGCTRAARLPPYNTPYLVRHPNGRTIELPHYTTSLDAAMTLVPEGWCWLITTEFDGITSAVWPPGNAEDYPDITAPAPALSLCAAALRARGETDG